MRRRRLCEGYEASLVALADRIIREKGTGPGVLNVRIAVDAEFHEEAGDHPKKPAVVVEAVLDEVVETIGSARRPVAVRFDDKRTLARIESGVERGGRLLIELRWRAKLALVNGRCRAHCDDERSNWPHPHEPPLQRERASLIDARALLSIETYGQ